jgi:hypothetical protein
VCDESPASPADEPTWDVLEVVAVLRLHVDDDTTLRAGATCRRTVYAGFERLRAWSARREARPATRPT